MALPTDVMTLLSLGLPLLTPGYREESIFLTEAGLSHLITRFQEEEVVI